MSNKFPLLGIVKLPYEKPPQPPALAPNADNVYFPAGNETYCKPPVQQYVPFLSASLYAFATHPASQFVPFTAQLFAHAARFPAEHTGAHFPLMQEEHPSFAPVQPASLVHAWPQYLPSEHFLVAGLQVRQPSVAPAHEALFVQSAPHILPSVHFPPTQTEQPSFAPAQSPLFVQSWAQ